MDRYPSPNHRDENEDDYYPPPGRTRNSQASWDEGNYPPPVHQRHPPQRHIPIHRNRKFFTIIAIIGIGIMVLGGTLCAISGITFRPDGDMDEEKYWKEEQDKDELTGFIYMLGTTMLQVGMLMFLMVIGLIVMNDMYPTGLRITAGIVVIILCQFFFLIFILSGPARLLNTIGGW